ncbi:MAG: hypothetical protein WAO91_08850 [Candidatus Nitrosotenuis sp.]
MDHDYLEKLGITMTQGRKGPNDKIFHYHGKPITMREFGELYALICQNEEQLYPKPRFKGSDMISEFLSDVKEAGKVTDEIAKKYKIK